MCSVTSLSLGVVMLGWRGRRKVWRSRRKDIIFRLAGPGMLRWSEVRGKNDVWSSRDWTCTVDWAQSVFTATSFGQGVAFVTAGHLEMLWDSSQEEAILTLVKIYGDGLAVAGQRGSSRGILTAWSRAFPSGMVIERKIGKYSGNGRHSDLIKLSRTVR